MKCAYELNTDNLVINCTTTTDSQTIFSLEYSLNGASFQTGKSFYVDNRENETKEKICYYLYSKHHVSATYLLCRQHPSYHSSLIADGGFQ